jgi:hypothetical protein
MRNSLLILSVLMQAIAFSQPFTPQQQEVINAENSFAGLSKSNNTVEAFLAYLSDSTIMFNGENKPVRGIDLYKDRKPDKSLLFWWPVFAGVSADGKMGFSTGPWEWSKSRDTLPQAFGYYATLWKKDKEGHWKMGVDLGVGFPASEKSNPPLKVSSGFRYSTAQARLSLSDYLLEDAAYNKLLKTASFRKERFTEDGHLLRSGYKPFASPGEFSSLDEKGKTFVYTQTYGGIAESEGMFYAYGTVKITSADDKTVDGKYLRVWKDVNSSWKIVLDVLSN